MAKRVVRKDGYFADPYASVRGTVDDPAREHDPELIDNVPDIEDLLQSAAVTPMTRVPAKKPRQRRRQASS